MTNPTHNTQHGIKVGMCVCVQKQGKDHGAIHDLTPAGASSAAISSTMIVPWMAVAEPSSALIALSPSCSLSILSSAGWWLSLVSTELPWGGPGGFRESLPISSTSLRIRLQKCGFLSSLDGTAR